MDSLTFKLPTELKKAIESLAASDGRTVSDYIRRHFSSIIPAQSAKKKGATK